MKIVDRGGGTPIVVIPGAQGRWEWMKPAIDALAQRCRVITFSLADEPSAAARFDPQRGFWCYVDQVGATRSMRKGVDRAAICGVSYGGLIAAVFAARYPDRASSLVLVSALPPSWTPDRRVQFFLQAPTSGAAVRHFVAAAVHRDRSRQPGAASGVRALFATPGASLVICCRRENGASGSIFARWTFRRLPV